MPHWSLDGDYLGRRLWTLEHFYAEAEAREFLPDAEAAYKIGYQWADSGGWVELLGNPPEVCPRYPMAFAAPEARDVVQRAIKLANWSENGNLKAVATLPLIPAQVDLIDLVKRGRARHERIQIESRLPAKPDKD